MNPLLLSGIFQFGEKIIEHFFPDPVEAGKQKVELLKLQESGDLARLASFTDLAKAQIALNTAEVQSGAWLGKWRGALGWVLSGSLLYQLVVHPFLVAVVLVFDDKFPVEKLPVLDWKQLGSVLLGMLGIGA